MPIVHDIFPSFNTGELSPRLAARIDFSKFKSGVDTLENFIVLSEGGAMRRSGSRFISEVKDSTVKSRLKRFEFSTTQAYILELGNQNMRFYRNQGQISVSDTDASITNGMFPTDTIGWFSRTPISVTNTDISFTAPDIITSGSSEFGVFATTDFIQIEGTASNDGLRFDIDTVIAGQIDTIEQTLTTEGAGASMTITKTLLTWNSGGWMDIQHDGTDAGIAEQSITLTTTSIEHVLKFRVIGSPGDSLTVRVGSSSGGSQFLADFEAKVGFHAIAFTPTASPMFLQFENTIADTTTGIDNISLIDNAGIDLETPWNEANIQTVEGPQSADILYMFHEGHPTHKLERRGNTTWSLVEVPWEDGPYLEKNAEATTLAPAATTGNDITLTASSIVGINDGVGFLSTDIGRSVRLSNPASAEQWGWAVIISVTSTTVVQVDIKLDFARTNADTNWRLGAWSSTTGYPITGAFFEQRLFAANTANQPQTFWASQSGDFELHRPDSDPTTPDIFDGTVEADDAIDYTISADDVNAIFWLSAGEDTLTIGTAGGEWVPSSVGSALTPSDISVRRQITTKAAQIQPIRVDNVVLFVQRAKRKIKEFGFAFEIDGFQAVDMTRLAQHITRGGITEMAFAEEQESQVWTVRGDGQLLSMTFRRNEDVVGWGRHIFGGSFSGGAAVAESVATIPGTDGAGQVQDSTSRDEVWVIVKRTINAATKRYVEMLEQDFETGDAQEDSYYSDSLITFDGAPSTVITGLDHLEGETLKILSDGAIHAEKTVVSGSVTLDTPGSVVQLGLGYTHKLKFLRLEGGNAAGTAVGKTKRIIGIDFILLNSHTIQFGPDASKLKEFDFRQVGDPMDAAAPLFTGTFYREFDGDWDDDPRVLIQHDDPAPFTLLAAAPRERLTAIK